MMSAWRQQRVSGKDAVTVLRLLYAYLAKRIETGCKQVRKSLRHMLYDDDSGKVGRQRRQ